MWLWDENGKRYLDALAGVAVCGLGHAHPAVRDALCEQAGRLIHTSNIYRIAEQERVGALLTALAGMDRVFFGNSGAEANEAAIKLARLHAHRRGVEDPAILVMENSFHGRTLATLTATGNRKVQAGFEPLVQGFVRVPYNDLAAVETAAANRKNIVAILVEPIQGEGGINIPDDAYLPGLRAICDREGWLLICDEIQTGIGRTGRMFGFQHTDMVPDVITLAKGLGNGVPIGACVARGAAAEVFAPGTHGSTFGGNPVGLSRGAGGAGDDRRRGAGGQCRRAGGVAGGGLPGGTRRGGGRDRRARARLDARDRARSALCRAGRPGPGGGAADQCHRRAGGAALAAPDPATAGGRAIGHLVERPDSLLSGGPLVSGSAPLACRHLLSLFDLSAAEARALLARGTELKAMLRRGEDYHPLRHRTLAMIFEKSSTRTRVSFEAGMIQFGGHAIFLSPRDTQLGRGEPIEDAARVLSRMVDAVMIRTFDQETVERFAAYSAVPTINGLTNRLHPCQVLADMQTYFEHRGDIRGRQVAWIGDGNNMCQSYMEAARLFDFTLRIACPAGFEPDAQLLAADAARFAVVQDPVEAARGADLIATDVWASMHQEGEQAQRQRVFAPYQVSDAVMAAAAPDALFMHCLPAHRGEEVAASVIDGPQSVVWDEAENRLHVQKALLEFLLVPALSPVAGHGLTLRCRPSVDRIRPATAGGHVKRCFEDPRETIRPTPGRPVRRPAVTTLGPGGDPLCHRSDRDHASRRRG